MSARLTIPVEFMLPAMAVKPSQAAQILNVSRTTIWRLCATGKLRKLECGVIPVSDLARFTDDDATIKAALEKEKV